MIGYRQLLLAVLLANYAESQWWSSQQNTPSRGCDSSLPPGTPQVSTRVGTIRGSSRTVDGRQYAVFLGVPYAQPPVGYLRFAEPQPLPDSQQCIDASRNYSAQCAQSDLKGGVNGAEDCLYLNVFTPSTTGRYPVMVWIHGGAFIFGSGNLNIDTVLRNLVSKDVVLVSINYRLGALGFWSTLTPTVRGNLGFYDQNMALRWVRDNIQQFGGDPSRVTIVGESAGGASISAQTLSPLSSGLFNQSIMMSGSMLGIWAITEDRSLSGLLQTFEDKVGCPQRRQPQWNSQFPDQALVQCMQGVPVETLVLTNVLSTTGGITIWTGRVDGKFFPADPAELAKRRPPLNTMMGTTKDEYASLSVAPFFPGASKNLVTTPDEIVYATIPRVISEEKFRNAQLVRQAVQAQYVKLAMANVTGNSQNYWFSQDNQLKSALFFFAPSYRDASLYAANGATVYLYSFDYESISIPQLNWKGAVHAGELYFLFGEAYPSDPLPSPFNSQMTQTMTTLWTNFVKFGNPTPPGSLATWIPLSSASSTNYFSVDAPTATMKQNYRSNDVSFWTRTVPMIEANGGDLCGRPGLWPLPPDFYSAFCSMLG